jgi:ferric-dicitrate binding protein FerR (iron transport regulator)
MKPDPQMQTEEAAYRAAYLIAGYIKRTLSTREHEELDAWVEASDENMKLFEDLTDEDNIGQAMSYFKSLNIDAAYDRVKAKIPFESPAKKTWPKLITIAIAASVIILVSIIWLVKHNDNATGNKDWAKQGDSSVDIAAGTHRATLHLANGKTILLDHTKKGILVNEDGVSIENSGESISYTGTAEGSDAMNTIDVPKGGQYTLQLSDGTTVWLNAASSITYPVSFTGRERKITLTGEAFFDVAPNAHQPFLVHTGDVDITVLGTRFNVQAYQDENMIRTTLVAGKVRVSTAKQSQELSLGRQALYRQGDLIVSEADTAAAMAWKNGNFSFRGEPIENVMRQVARWYDVQVEYKEKINQHFTAEISRDVPLSKMLGLLQKTSSVHFNINNRTIIVSP